MNNKFILGTVQMGLPYGINNTTGKVSLDNSLDILKYAFDHGICLLDSAKAYGNAHEVIGLFHKRYPDKRFKVITKLPNVVEANITDTVDGYLKELRVPRLHALLFHSYKSYKDNIKNIEVFKTLKHDRKIELLGVSVYTNNEIEDVILDDAVDVIQLPFNLFDNTNLRGGLIEKAEAKGKIVHTRSALLQGLFFKDVTSELKIVQNLRSELMQLASMTSVHQLSISKMALSYCLQQKSIDNVLIGVDSIVQLKDNLEAINFQLKQTVLDEINTIKIKDVNLLNPALWQ